MCVCVQRRWRRKKGGGGTNDITCGHACSNSWCHPLLLQAQHFKQTSQKVARSYWWKNVKLVVVIVVVVLVIVLIIVLLATGVIPVSAPLPVITPTPTIKP